MILADVIGTVVTDQMSSWIENDNPVFLIVQPVTSSGKSNADPFVALDLLGAAPGERVIVSQGSSVRQTPTTKDRPVDAVISGIVDLVDTGGKTVYAKDA